jgi:hypothetical protein
MSDNSNYYHAYMKGWFCGAGRKTIPREVVEHKDEAIRGAFMDGYEDGCEDKRDASRYASEHYGYEPNILRTYKE